VYVFCDFKDIKLYCRNNLIVLLYCCVSSDKKVSNARAVDVNLSSVSNVKMANESELEARLIPIINKLAVDEGFGKFKLDFRHGSDAGFIGLIRKCRITDDRKELSVVCKVLPNDVDRNFQYNSFMLFEREVFVYQHVTCAATIREPSN